MGNRTTSLYEGDVSLLLLRTREIEGAGELDAWAFKAVT